MNTPIEKTSVDLPGKVEPDETPERDRPANELNPETPIEIPAVGPDPKPPAGSPRMQMQQTMQSGDALSDRWRQQVDAAKQMWEELTDDELLQLQGDEQKLIALVQERYAVSPDEAARQTHVFSPST